MKNNRLIGTILSAGMAAWLGVCTVQAQPTVIRDTVDPSNFIAIEGLTVDGLLYNVELRWAGAKAVYGGPPGTEYTFTDEAAATLAAQAMNNALNDEGDITGVGSGRWGGRGFFEIGFEDYAPAVGLHKARSRSGFFTVDGATWSDKTSENDFASEEWYAVFTETGQPAVPPELTALTISEGTLTPAFAGATRDYTATVPYEISSVTVTPTAEDGTAIAVNGVPVTSGEASTAQVLNMGENEILIELYADSSSSYSIMVTREQGPPPPMLTALTISEGTLAPEFAGATRDYTATVPWSAVAVTVTPTAEDGTAIAVNGETVLSGEASSPQILSVGENEILIQLFAEGQAESSYRVVVTREEGPPPAELTGLTISEGTLSPAFNGATRAYTATVPYEISSVTVTPTAAAPEANIVVGGALVPSGQPSAPQNVYVGENGLMTLVFSGGTAGSYDIVVTREEEQSTELAVIRDTVNTNTAIGIENLLVDGILYDVAFQFVTANDIYGSTPGDHTFPSEATATVAADAVNSALNGEGDITSVGSDIPAQRAIFHIGFETSGEGGLARQLARSGRADGGGAVWNPLASEFGRIDRSSYAVFTEIGPPPDTAPTLTIAITAPSEATIDWSPDTAGFILQTSADLGPPNWTNAESGSNHPVTVDPTQGLMFYRLIKP